MTSTHSTAVASTRSVASDVQNSLAGQIDKPAQPDHERRRLIGTLGDEREASMSQPRRRRFLIASSALLAAPFFVEAEPTKKSYRIGFLLGLRGRKGGTAPFEQGLRELGWVNGQNVTIEYRSAEGHFDRLPALATDRKSVV